MNRKQRTLLATSFIIGVLCFLPGVMGIIPVNETVPAGGWVTAVHFPLGFKNFKIPYNATGTIDIFVTDDMDDILEYDASGLIPAGVIANQTGTNGILCITYSNTSSAYSSYIVLGNKNGASSIDVTYEVDLGRCGGIPGFGTLLVFFALLAIFGILWSKKRLNL